MMISSSEPESSDSSLARPLWRHYLAALGIQADHLANDPNPPAELEAAIEANVRHVGKTVAHTEALNAEAAELRARRDAGKWTDADSTRTLEVLAGFAQLQVNTRTAMAALLTVAARYQKPPEP